jgi:hypothetical protein
MGDTKIPRLAKTFSLSRIPLLACGHVRADLKPGTKKRDPLQRKLE